MLTIGFLADYLNTIPTLINWFREQWHDYYADMLQAEMEQDFLEDASRERLPIRLVAFESNELVGTIILRDQNEKLAECQPELGGLYVLESHRGQGIATELFQAGMQLALDQGYKIVFATTVNARGILERLGWEFIKTIVYEDGQVALYQCKL